jgi:DNA-binding NarL/FixJ family response regulator
MTTIVIIGELSQVSVLQTAQPGNHILQKLNTKTPSGISTLDDVLRMQNYFSNTRNWHCLAPGKNNIVIYYEKRNRRISTQQLQSQQLSFRQYQVLYYLCIGYTNQRIAAALSLHTNTVNCHIRFIKELLGVESRAEIAGKAAASGLFTPGSPPPQETDTA